MTTKIGFVHTGVAIADMFKPMIAERLPGISTFHIVDDSLIQDLLQEEQFTPSILKRLCSQIELAEEAGAEVIMVTCSSIAPGVDVARKMVKVPVLKIDEPMAEKAAEANKQITIHQTLSSEAFDCFLKGDMQTHDEIVKDAAQKVKGKVGVIVLAQASMGHLAEDLQEITGVPVLKSPPLAMDALVAKVMT